MNIEDMPEELVEMIVHATMHALFEKGEVVVTPEGEVLVWSEFSWPG